MSNDAAFGRISKGERVDDVKRRAKTAAHPPKVKLQPVKSTAVAAMGYQPQTRRLAYAMHSRPERPYEYRATPKAAQQAMSAPSIGRYYTTNVRGKVKRATRYTAADRARLFLDPPDGGEQ